MDLVEITTEIRRVAERLDKAPAVIEKRQKEWAKAEYEYRLALSQEILKLKAEGMSVTLISDIARGTVAELKYNRDLTEGLCISAREAKKALESELSSLQSLLRYQDNV